MRKTNFNSRAFVAAVLASLLAACLVGVGGGVAAAGETCTDGGYPDGCTPTTEPTGGDPECTLSATQAAPGDTVEATVTNVPGDTTVSLRFDGTEVASETTDAGSETTDVTVAFTVPDADPGRHDVAAVLSGETSFTASCRSANGAEGLVLSAGQGRGGLPQTGLLLGGFLAIALALVLFGRLLLGASRSRGLRDRAGI